MFGFFKKKVQETKVENEIVAEDFTDVTSLASYLKAETGVTFEKQMAILKNKVSTYCRKQHIHSFGELLQKVHTDEVLKQGLFDCITTNETFFYREFKQINELVDLVKVKDHKVRILCAPCSSGEEPFSIAIALLEAGVDAERFKIVGIDINLEALQKAEKALYKERNLRNFTTEIRAKYFTKSQEEYALNASVKNLVSFEKFNLFDKNFSDLGKFDYVFSRNMLIYFDKETKQKAKKILESMRKDETHAVFFGHADLF